MVSFDQGASSQRSVSWKGIQNLRKSSKSVKSVGKRSSNAKAGIGTLDWPWKIQIYRGQDIWCVDLVREYMKSLVVRCLHIDSLVSDPPKRNSWSQKHESGDL